MSVVKFGDVVKEVKSKIDRNNNPYEFYVAGDHMDSEDLHLHRKGSFATDDVGPAFIREFLPGQILYGSRRTYLKKVAVADFSGVTANTTFVLETKNEKVLRQRLIPFIMLSDAFTEWSISKSKGSTNPYVLFSDLAGFEFELPTIEEQDKLVNLLWSMDDVIVSYKDAIAKTDDLVKSQFIEMFGLPEHNVHGFETGKISDVVKDVHYGTAKKASENGKYIYIRMNNITYEGNLDLSDIKHIDVSEKELAGCMVQQGDVLFNRTNSKDLVGKTCYFSGNEPMIIAGYIIRLRMNGKVVPEYLSIFMNLDRSKKLLYNMAKGAVGQANINSKEVQSIEIVIPPEGIQRSFLLLLKQSDKSKFALKDTMKSVEAMINKIVTNSFKIDREEG